jgi:ribonuclease P protein component
MRLFFRKKEKLTSEKEIDLLFKQGRSNFIYPIKVVYTFIPQTPKECRVLVSASKRYLRKASERNLVKRRLKEAYRSNATDFKKMLIDRNIGANIAIIYVSSKILVYCEIEEIMKNQIANLVSNLEKGEKRV